MYMPPTTDRAWKFFCLPFFVSYQNVPLGTGIGNRIILGGKVWHGFHSMGGGGRGPRCLGGRNRSHGHFEMLVAPGDSGASKTQKWPKKDPMKCAVAFGRCQLSVLDESNETVSIAVAF